MYKKIIDALFIIAPFLYCQSFLNIKVNTDNTTQIQNEQQIVINPTDTLNFVADRRDFRLGYRQVCHAASLDGGIDWLPNVRITNVSFDLRADSETEIEPYNPSQPLAEGVYFITTGFRKVRFEIVK